MLCCKTPVTSKIEDEMILEGKEIKSTLVISLAFQFVFTAFNAMQNLHSSLHDEHSLGLICLSTIYFTAIVSSIFSPTIIGLMGAKNVLVVYFLAHCVYVTVSFYPSFATMVPAAVCVGAFHGSAWSSQALYVSANAYSYSKRPHVESPYDVLTRFNLFFFATFATTQIGGNLVASAILGSSPGSPGNSSDSEAAFQHCGINDCPHLTNTTEMQDPEKWAIYTLRGVFLGCTVGGLLLVLALLPPLPRSDWLKKSVSVRSNITSCFSVLVTSDMLLLVPLILFTSIQQAFLVGTYTESYIACALGIHMVGYAMAAYGATTPVFAFIIARLSRFTGRFLLVTVSMGVHIILLAILLHWSPDEGDVVTLFIVPAVWGVAESVLLAQANSLIFALNVSQKEPAFANYQAWRSLGYFVTFLNLTYLCVSIKLILCLTCAALGLVLYVVVEFRTQFRERTVFEKHDSIASISPRGSIRADDVSRTSSERSNVTSPLMTPAGQTVFHRRELYDVIREAQTGWRRNSRAGFTLDISRLSARTSRGPNAVDITSLFRSNGANAAMIRSLSEGHLKTLSDGPGTLLVVEPSSTTEYNYKELPENDPSEKKSAVMRNNFLSTSDDDELFHKGIVAGQCAVKQSSNDHLDAMPREMKKSFIKLLSESFQKLNVDNGEPTLTDFEYTVLSPIRSAELDSANGDREPDDNDKEHDDKYNSQDDPESTPQQQGGDRSSRNRPRSLQPKQPLSLDQGYMSEDKEQDAAGRLSTQVSEHCDDVTPRSSSAASRSASVKMKKTLSFISRNSFRRSKKMRKVSANDERTRRSVGLSRQDSEGFFPDDDFEGQNSFPEYALNVRAPRGQATAQDDSISIY